MEDSNGLRSHMLGLLLGRRWLSSWLDHRREIGYSIRIALGGKAKSCCSIPALRWEPQGNFALTRQALGGSVVGRLVNLGVI